MDINDKVCQIIAKGYICLIERDLENTAVSHIHVSAGDVHL